MAGLYEDLFAMVLASKGAFSHSELYDMPVQIRKFYMTKLKELLENPPK